MLDLGTGEKRGDGAISAVAYSAGLRRGPRPEIMFKRRVGLRASAREVWAYRELLITLIERDLRVRYKQAALGLAWAVISPIVEMIAFTVLFTKVTHIRGIPEGRPVRPVLLPWTDSLGVFLLGGQRRQLQPDQSGTAA